MIVVNFVYYSVAFALGNSKNHFILVILKYILWMLLVLWATNLDTLVANSLSAISLTFGKTRVSIWFLFKQLSVVLIDVAIMLWVSSIFDNWVKNAKDLDANIKQLLTRISKVLIIGIGIYIILPSLGIDLTALSIFGGAVGVGLGFGLQKIASNFLSGFIILVDKSVKIGDRVIINDVTGTITKITTRYTVMQAFDGSEIIIPNERFITDTIINQTHTNNEISLDLMISVSYTANLTLAIEIIRNCIQQIDNIRKDKEPSVYIKTLNASGIDIFIRVWPEDPINETNLVRNKLNIALVESLQAHQIEIPFPKLDVNLIKS
jgi:small-conductance mechanosensitive channel